MNRLDRCLRKDPTLGYGNTCMDFYEDYYECVHEPIKVCEKKIGFWTNFLESKYFFLFSHCQTFQKFKNLCFFIFFQRKREEQVKFLKKTKDRIRQAKAFPGPSMEDDPDIYDGVGNLYEDMLENVQNRSNERMRKKRC